MAFPTFSKFVDMFLMSFCSFSWGRHSLLGPCFRAEPIVEEREVGMHAPALWGGPQEEALASQLSSMVSLLTAAWRPLVLRSRGTVEPSLRSEPGPHPKDRAKRQTAIRHQFWKSVTFSINRHSKILTGTLSRGGSGRTGGGMEQKTMSSSIFSLEQEISYMQSQIRFSLDPPFFFWLLKVISLLHSFSFLPSDFQDQNVLCNLFSLKRQLFIIPEINLHFEIKRPDVLILTHPWASPPEALQTCPSIAWSRTRVWEGSVHGSVRSFQSGGPENWRIGIFKRVWV